MIQDDVEHLALSNDVEAKAGHGTARSNGAIYGESNAIIKVIERKGLKPSQKGFKSQDYWFLNPL